MINFYGLSNVELCMSYIQKDIEHLQDYGIHKGHDYSSVLGIIKRDVMKCRWKEAEPYIMKNTFWAAYYAFNVIKGRWLEAEPAIMENEWHWLEYCQEFGL